MKRRVRGILPQFASLWKFPFTPTPLSASGARERNFDVENGSV